MTEESESGGAEAREGVRFGVGEGIERVFGCCGGVGVTGLRPGWRRAAGFQVGALVLGRLFIPRRLESILLVGGSEVGLEL